MRRFRTTMYPFLKLSALALSATLVVTAPAWSMTGDVDKTDRVDPAGPTAAAGPPVKIVVNWRSPQRFVHPKLLGANQHFQHDGLGSWDARHHKPRPRIVAGMRRAGVSLLRYPGGIAANLFDWKAAIGRTRGCQVDARKLPSGYRAFGRTAYGPDENARLTKAARADSSIMVPFINESPRDAADWVEYMNSPAGTKANPHGGKDWAEVRAGNGHRAPYQVHRWEIGNEQRTPDQRYWMSSNQAVALRQYVHGATVRTRGEQLGKHCAHPRAGIPSNGAPGQVFELLYTPVVRGSVAVRVAGKVWRRVSHVSKANRDQPVFELGPNGQVRFGNGRHGRIPPRHTRVSASYTSHHAGVFSFIRAMRAVDPSIEVCPSWGLKEFVAEARGHRYQCFTAHSYTHFRGEHHGHWAGPLEGHDWSMLGARTEERFVAELLRKLPAGTSLPLTEFGMLDGDNRAFPTWAISMTHALYMATQWVNWMDLGIPWAEGENLILAHQRGLLGSAGSFSYGASAVARTAILPMFGGGGRQVSIHVAHNPRRNPHLGAGTYAALKVAATHSRSGQLFLLVINRMPDQRGAVNATVLLDGFTSSSHAVVRQVTSSGFEAANLFGQKPGIRLSQDKRSIGSRSFDQWFPAHSITLIRVPPS